MTVNPTVSRFAAFECLETCLAECSQGRKIDGRKGRGGGAHLSRCLLFVRSSLEVFGLLGTTKRERGDRKRALRPSTDKAKAEKDKFTSLIERGIWLGAKASSGFKQSIISHSSTGIKMCLITQHSLHILFCRVNLRAYTLRPWVNTKAVIQNLHITERCCCTDACTNKYQV